MSFVLVTVVVLCSVSRVQAAAVCQAGVLCAKTKRSWKRSHVVGFCHRKQVLPWPLAVLLDDAFDSRHAAVTQVLRSAVLQPDPVPLSSRPQRRTIRRAGLRDESRLTSLPLAELNLAFGSVEYVARIISAFDAPSSTDIRTPRGRFPHSSTNNRQILYPSRPHQHTFALIKLEICTFQGSCTNCPKF